ncbi:MAG: hypothetical protein U7123_10010 [Potamolinea sp.]
MWVLNVILIFALIGSVSWLLWNYGDNLTKAISVLFSGSQSILFVLGILLVDAVKAAFISAAVGGIFGLIFFVARAPEITTKSVAFSIACLVFSLLMLKALWENLNNLRYSIRHEIRNRYRKY